MECSVIPKRDNSIRNSGFAKAGIIMRHTCCPSSTVSTAIGLACMMVNVPACATILGEFRGPIAATGFRSTFLAFTWSGKYCSRSLSISNARMSRSYARRCPACRFRATGSRNHRAASLCSCFPLGSQSAKYNATNGLSVQSSSRVGARWCCIRNTHSQSDSGYSRRCGRAFWRNSLMMVSSAFKWSGLRPIVGTNPHAASACPRYQQIFPTCAYSRGPATKSATVARFLSGYRIADLPFARRRSSARVRYTLTTAGAACWREQIWRPPPLDCCRNRPPSSI